MTRSCRIGQVLQLAAVAHPAFTTGSGQEARRFAPPLQAPSLFPLASAMRALLVLVTVAALAIASGAGPSIAVCPSGTNAPNCGTGGNAPCADLSYAVNNVFPNDAGSGGVTLALCAGRFGPASCNVTLPGSAAVVGAGAGATVVDCEGQYRMLQVLGPLLNVTLANLTIVNGHADDDTVGGAFGGSVFVMWEFSGDTDTPLSVVVDGLNVSNSRCGH